MQRKNLVTLRNGAELSEDMVNLFMDDVTFLFMRDPGTLHELYKLVDEPTHELTQGVQNTLYATGLLQKDGTVCEPLKDFIKSAVEYVNNELLVLRHPVKRD